MYVDGCSGVTDHGKEDRGAKYAVEGGDLAGRRAREERADKIQSETESCS